MKDYSVVEPTKYRI